MTDDTKINDICNERSNFCVKRKEGTNMNSKNILSTRQKVSRNLVPRHSEPELENRTVFGHSSKTDILYCIAIDRKRYKNIY